MARVLEALDASETSEAHDALDHLALELSSEERMAYGAFARFDKNRNHFLQGIEIVPGAKGLESGLKILKRGHLID